MYTTFNTSDYRSLAPGIKMRPLVFGQKTLLCEFMLEKGYQIPWHNHPYEQTGFLVSGHLIFRIGEENQETHPGDSWCIPENIFHSVDVLEDAYVLELFSPPRPDYLPGNLK